MNPLNTGTGLNPELPPNGAAPDWVELIPAGPSIIGRDGRSWLNDQPDAIVTAYQNQRIPLVIDWEHATERRAPQGEEAPAAGWLVALQNRLGAIWGKAEWTTRARNQIGNREYRFLSPTFLYHKSTSRIAALTSVALTNQPNLHLTALNQRAPLPAILPLTETETAICQRMGIDPGDFWRHKTTTAANAINPAAALLSDAEQEICRGMGIAPADFLHAKQQYRTTDLPGNGYRPRRLSPRSTPEV
ncbi:MAG: phage protease [Candidatus Competibacteraceae bacterium]|jgi:phage I-like protein|nr:phage protease [Candidatus Competibacteraceae bacterium]